MGTVLLENVPNSPLQLDKLGDLGKAGNCLVALVAPPVATGVYAHGFHPEIETPLRQQEHLQLLALWGKGDLVVSMQLGEPLGIAPHTLEENLGAVAMT